MSVQSITDSLSAYASSIIGAAYDVFSDDIKNGLWKVIASVLDELLSGWLDYGMMYVRDATAGQSLGVSWELITLLVTEGLASDGVRPDIGAHRLTANTPGLYFAAVGLSFSDGADRTFDFELRQWDETAGSSIASGFAASRLLPSAGSIGATVLFGLFQLDEMDGVELWGRSNLADGATCIIKHGQALIIRLGA